MSGRPVARQQAALARGIEPVTERTVTDPAALAAELETARRCGWAGSDAERTPGIRAVAAPVFDHTGMAVGALGLSVPSVRMDDARADELGARAAAVAWEVSEALGATRELVDERLALAREPGSAT
ncbi:IclR family transcriptional regulator C-terminal domain-containing protein [Nocardioides sp.]|uniref:IclR family transcriptional regulator domain-containing protein n=1 Tax=Nocardioides sp. TaxID=35761 RepID=UPI0026155D32|nr:IclR family transcriptional regulator C-terminal domain-containing protein [Nocardioides sp.]MCW2735837.1 transcriptional regulator, IclR family protein [Nocardioides sp.]